MTNDTFEWRGKQIDNGRWCPFKEKEWTCPFWWTLETQWSLKEWVFSCISITLNDICQGTTRSVILSRSLSFLFEKRILSILSSLWFLCLLVSRSLSDKVDKKDKKRGNEGRRDDGYSNRISVDDHFSLLRKRDAVSSSSFSPSSRSHASFIRSPLHLNVSKNIIISFSLSLIIINQVNLSTSLESSTSTHRERLMIECGEETGERRLPLSFLVKEKCSKSSTKEEESPYHLPPSFLTLSGKGGYVSYLYPRGERYTTMEGGVGFDLRPEIHVTSLPLSLLLVKKN